MMDIDAAIAAGAGGTPRRPLARKRTPIRRIHETAKAVLAEVGIHTRNPAVISCLEQTGLAGYDASVGRVYLLPELIEMSLASAAKTYAGDEGPNTLGIGGIPPFLYREKDRYPMPATYEELDHLIHGHRGKPGRGAVSQSAGQGAQRGPASMQPDHGSAAGLHQGHLQRLPAG